MEGGVKVVNVRLVSEPAAGRKTGRKCETLRRQGEASGGSWVVL
jgi:hypothetical protein